MDEQQDLVSVYRAELDALRRAGAAFARQHPTVARELELGPAGSSDPHVERLIESVAFLTARVQKRMDDRYPDLTTGLLGALYPNLVQPVPPMSIAQCAPDTSRGKILAGLDLVRGTEMFFAGQDGSTCSFQSSYDTTVWPLEVAEVGVTQRDYPEIMKRHPEAVSILRLRLRTIGCDLRELQTLDRLRFYLNGESRLTGELYELVLRNTLHVVLYDPDDPLKYVTLPASSLSPVGFREDEAVIPQRNDMHPAYRLLQEYFTLPQKFLFFDLAGLGKRPDTARLEVLLLLNTLPRERMLVTPDMFLLGCTPVVNLFERLSEPIRIDHLRSEYRLIPDLRREATTEIHSVVKVINSNRPQDESAVLRPFYDFSHEPMSSTMFWHARRQPADDSGLEGTDVYLSLVDLEFNPMLPPSDTVYARVLCTNRNLAPQLPHDAPLFTEKSTSLKSIRLLFRPTQTGYPPLGGSSRWALISALSLSQLSLDGDDPLPALKKILRLYAMTDAPQTMRPIEGIEQMSTRPVLRRNGHSWRGWSQGRQVLLTLNDNAYRDTSIFLFASLLRHFFALYGSVNTFVELAVRTTGKQNPIRFPVLSAQQQVF